MNSHLLLLIPMTLFGSLGAVFLKMYASKKVAYLFLGLGFYGLGALTNIYLLKELPYTLVFPANALTYVWVVFFAFFLLKEKIKFTQVIGIMFIVCGVMFLIKS